MNDRKYASPLNPEMVEGPYYSRGGTYRSDIREGQDGVVLNLAIKVIDANTGQGLAGSDVDLWQCNATGHYSGYDADPDELPADISNGQKASNPEIFLRGRQTTDVNGTLQFITIYPGWYVLRTPHIHLKVFTKGRCNVTTQLYLPENLNQKTYENDDYRRTIEQDTHNCTDPVIGKFGGESPTIWIEVDETAAGFNGSATVTVDPNEDREPIFIPSGRVPPLGGFEHKIPVR
jgi:protocatechuate 3,4-dioxygenase beta subunit